MDDERVEAKLRESWAPEMPDGMRARVLRRARAELRARRRPWWAVVPLWQRILVTACVLAVLLAGVCDRARSERIAAMTDSTPGQRALPVRDLLRQRREMARLVAPFSDEKVDDASGKDGSL